MNQPALTSVEHQVRRAGRRLFVQALLDRLVWCWAGALGFAVVWFLLQPLLLSGAEEWVRWAVGGAAAIVATGLAVALTCLTAPTRLGAALELDRRFQLRERVTTLLSLGAGQEDCPAARALLDDVTRHVSGKDVPARFPLRLSWSAVAVPVAAVVLGLVAFFYDPSFGTSVAGAEESKLTNNPKEIQEKLDELKKALARERAQDELKSKELEDLEKALEKLLKQPLDPNNKEQVRDLVQQMRPLEEKIKDRLADLKARADKGKDLKDRLKELGALDPKGAKEGPGKDFEKALAEGKLDKAAEELERLRKKLDEDKLNTKEREQLEQQFRDLQERLKRLADLEDLKERLQKALNNKELLPEEFDQRMQDLLDNAPDLQDLKDLADRLGECLKCLQKGDKANLGKHLKGLKGKLMALDPEARDKALKDLEKNKDAVCAACDAMLLGLMNKDGLGQGPKAGRQRPMGKDGPVGQKATPQRAADFKDDAPLRITGFTKGGTFTRIPARDVGGAFRQAVQDAPSAIERQRVPPDAADLLKGYYENLGGQK
ncbi:MAG: hypothetical protein L0Z62_03025 [Gemmataceae bacterium]|nr:hypothetical protein [Gemmataceae bacterium]